MTTPSAYALQRVVSLALQSLEILRAEHGQVIDDDEALLTALSQEGVSFEAVIARIGRAALQARADAAAASAMIDDLTIRRDRFRRHEESWRGVILAAMEAVGISKMGTPQFSVSITPGRPKVLITNEMMLADDLVITTRAPDKAAIRQALETRNDVPGAVLSQAPPTLTLRSK